MRSEILFNLPPQESPERGHMLPVSGSRTTQWQWPRCRPSSSPVQAHVPNSLCKAGREKVAGMLQVCFCQRLDQHGAVLYLPLLPERLQLLPSLGLQESRWESSWQRMMSAEARGFQVL